MASHAPWGVSWLSWHFQRTYNGVEYLRMNGYFSSYGFSIFDACQECSLDAIEWVDKIYMSMSAMVLTPYIALNHFWGKEGLQFYGPIVDKVVIFVAGVAAAELIIRCIKSYSRVAVYFVGISAFGLFISAPWTYRMVLAGWSEIYFWMFFLVGVLSFVNSRNGLAYLFFLLAGLFHYQWALAVALFYILILIISFLTKDIHGSKLYFPPSVSEGRQRFFLLGSLLLPAITFLAHRFIGQQYLGDNAGSSFISRIGISGEDPYNGGLIGALQFLGGTEISQCFASLGTVSGVLGSVNTYLDVLPIFNCMLSIGSMTALSLLAILGIGILLKKSESSRWIILPISFALIVFITTLQQALSVHLMGISYIFSFLFAAGMLSLIVFFEKHIQSSVLITVFAIPCLIGIIFLSIRVSMLIGGNG